MPKRFLFVLGILAVLGWACSLGAPDTPTPAPTMLPTAPPPTPTQLPPTPVPLPTATPTQPEATVTLGDDLYEHPQGLFAFHPPQGWQKQREGDAFVIFTPAGEGTSTLIVTAINTGDALDSQSFANLVSAYEQSYQMLDGYQEDESVLLEHGATMSKRVVSGGTPYYVLSRYYQDGQGVIIIDVTVSPDDAAAGDGLANALEADLRYDSQAIAAQPIYADVWQFVAPGELFTMGVPIAWYYTFSYEDTVSVDRFDSPDDEAFIESVIYDDGTPLSKSDIGKVALDYLREIYASDLTINDDQVQADGSERLIWHSAENQISGATFFEKRGDTTLMLLTFISSDAKSDIYLDLFDRILATYDVP